MFSRFFKKKEKKKVWEETEEVVATKVSYKPFEWSRTPIEGGVEYEIRVTDTYMSNVPSHLKCYKIKIMNTVGMSYKLLNLKTNQVERSHFEAIPCYGFEKMTLEYSCRGVNQWEYLFGFQFWHSAPAVCAEEKDAYLRWSSGFIYNTEYIEGLEEVLYQIQVDIQEAIERVNE